MDVYKNLEFELNLQGKKRLIFSEFFILQNKIQTRFDKFLGVVTSKQIIILLIVKTFPYPPSLSEVAVHAGCSRQNIKKIAAVLQNKGFIKLVPEKETRAIRIVLEPKFYEFYNVFMEKSKEGLDILFDGMSEDEIEALFIGLHKVENNIDRFNEKESRSELE